MGDNSQIKMEWLGDSASAQKAIDELKRKNDELADAVKRAGKQAHEDSEGFKGYVSEQIGGVANMVAGYVSLEKAIDLVADSYKEWVGRMKEAAEAAKELRDTEIPGLTKQGLLGRADEAEAHFASNNLATRAQMQSGFFAVGDGGEGTLSFERQMALSSAGSRLAPVLGNDLAEQQRRLGAVGRLVGDKKSADDAANLAFGATQITGQRGGELFDPAAMKAQADLIRAGLSPEQAMAFGITSIQHDLGTRELPHIAELATKKYSGQELKKFRTANQKHWGASEKAQYDLMQTHAGGERLQKLLAHPEAAGDDKVAQSIKLFGSQDMLLNQRKLEEAEHADAIGQTLGTERGREANKRGKKAREDEDAKLVDAKQGEITEEAGKALSNTLSNNHVEGFARIIAEKAGSVNRVFHNLTGDSAGADAAALRGAAGALSLVPGGSDRASAELSREAISIQRQQLEETKKLRGDLHNGSNSAAAHGARNANGKEG
ncbi:MAG TPA: hypothetical protein VHY20_16040 [Pirellulales bacterium]|nr:hypothetical protein [Pirellulales bacterium]